LLGVAVAALGCYASYPGRAEPDDDRSDDSAGTEVGHEADVPGTCIPTEFIDLDEPIADPWAHEGREAWVHGLGVAWNGGPYLTFCPSPIVCHNDACCNECEAGVGLLGQYERLGVIWPVDAEPRCAGNDCRMVCTPWSAGTEMYVHGVLSGLDGYGGLLTADREPCVLGIGPYTGTWRVRVRSMDFERCPSPIVATGLEGSFIFWFEAGAPTAALWLHPISAAAVPLTGTFDGSTLNVHSTRSCGHCPCVFDVRATFDGYSSLVGTAYIEEECECVAAFSFEGRWESPRVTFPPPG
jgi:hypothetical protein